MTAFPLILLLACRGPSAPPQVEAPAAGSSGTATTATGASAAPTSPSGRATRAAATTLPATESGLAPGSPTPVASLDLEQTRLGVSVPNAVKGMAVAYDPTRDELWHAGIFSTWLVAHDPETGAPLRAVDIQVEGFNPAKLHVDAERRRLIWVNARSEQVRIVDLDSGTLLHRIDVEARGSNKYPTNANALDVADGRTWVWNANNRTLSGYDGAGGPTTSLSDFGRVFELSAAPSGGKLVVLDVASPESARALMVDTRTGTRTEVCTFTGRPPRNLAALDDGGLILGETKIRRVNARCEELWSVEVAEAPDTLVVAGGTVVAPLATGGKARGGIGSEVALIDLETGALKGLVPSRWEARFVAVDTKAGPSDGGRVWVGNGGDGSATLIPLPDGAQARVLPLASSADDVVVDPTNGDRYVLSRLGGGKIWRWRAGQASAEVFAEDCPWPFVLALDPARRLLLAPSYFEGRLYTWPLDGGPARVVDLGIPGSTGDALGDFSYDPTSGVAAVVLPMEGWLSVVDVTAGTVRYTRQFTEMAAGPKAGPGRGNVLVSDGSVYVADAAGGRLWRLDATADSVLAQTGPSPSTEAKPGGATAGSAGERPPRPEGQRPAGAGGARPPRPEGSRPPRPDGERPPRPAGGQAAGGGDRPERGHVYAFGLFFHDQAGGRLFYGNQVLDPKTLELKQTLPGDLKVFWASAERIVALAVGANGKQDDIVLLDPTTLAETRRIPGLSTPTAHSEAAWDPTTNTVWLADLPRARVTGFKVD